MLFSLRYLITSIFAQFIIIWLVCCLVQHFADIIRHYVLFLIIQFVFYWLYLEKKKKKSDSLKIRNKVCVSQRVGHLRTLSLSFSHYMWVAK